MSNYIDNIVKNAVTYDLVSKPLANDMANEFSIQSTYAVGDYVMHDYKLYKCISAVTTAGNWNSAKWQECKIGDEINGGVKFTAQTLTSEQKAQARNNIGGASQADLEALNAVRYDQAQTLTTAQKTQARANIGAVSQEEATPDAIRYSAQSLTDAQKNQARVNVGTVASTNIAEEFSTSKAYAVGDMVMYNSKLYKFKTAHSAGAWNNAQVDVVSLESELSGIKNDLSDAREDVNKLNEGGLVIKDEVIAEDIQNWLDEHPEATTTVQDGSITPPKFASNAISIDTWSGTSSINNWSGETLEDKLLDFLNNADSGSKLDLQGVKITITKRFIKSKRTALNNTIISNGIFEIPASVDGWLSIGSSGGYRVPLFVNCMFTGGGSIFYGSSYNFKAVGCSFYDVQILNGTYLQACELDGCNIMCPNNYLIECDYAIGFTMTHCTFEAGNYGVFKGNGNSARPSLEYGGFTNCVFEGFTNDVFVSYGMRCVSFNSCYAEQVPHLIYDKSGEDDSANIFYITINNCRIYFASSQSDYLIYSTASIPSVSTQGNYFAGNGNQFLTNVPNSRHQMYGLNYNDNKIYGNNGNASERVATNHAFNGTTHTFSTNGVGLTSQPQAFLVIANQYVKNTSIYPKISILTLTYKASTGYTINETVLFKHESFLRAVTWTASADEMLGTVNITGVYDKEVYASIVNLGATLSGMIL